MNLWTLLLVGVGAIQLIGLFTFLLSAFRAPAGYQDNDGFHLVTESAAPQATHKVVVMDSGEDTLPPFGRAA
jgi:hypothetical protein